VKELRRWIYTFLGREPADRIGLHCDCGASPANGDLGRILSCQLPRSSSEQCSVSFFLYSCQQPSCSKPCCLEKRCPNVRTFEDSGARPAQWIRVAAEMSPPPVFRQKLEAGHVRHWQLFEISTTVPSRRSNRFRAAARALRFNGHAWVCLESMQSANQPLFSDLHILPAASRYNSSIGPDGQHLISTFRPVKCRYHMKAYYTQHKGVFFSALDSGFTSGPRIEPDGLLALWAR
jgi:hypothetical protein